MQEEYEMFPLQTKGQQRPASSIIPPQTPAPPFPQYYYMPSAAMPFTQPVPYVAPLGQVPPQPQIYTVPYPVFSIPPSRGYAQPSSAPIESELPSYAQLYPQKQRTLPPPVVLNDNDFFQALRPKAKTTPSTSPKETSIQTRQRLPNIERLLQEPESEVSGQQRCKNCCSYYKEEQNHDTACFYHSGRYKTPESVRPIMMPIANLQRWTCCKATSKEAQGCKNSRHILDESTNAIINRFAEAVSLVGPRQQQPSSAPGRDALLVDLDSDEDAQHALEKEGGSETAESEGSVTKEMLVWQKFHARPGMETTKEAEGGQKLVRHVVISTDTLSGVALKYGVKVSDIKRANNLLGDSIFERKHLDIPNPSRVPDAENLAGVLPKCGKEEIAISRFMSAAKCCKAEAKYYLTEYEFEMEKALAAFFEDEEWGHRNPVPTRAK